MDSPACRRQPRSAELERRLRARARRAAALRRRVAALTITLFLGFWIAIYASGAFGASTVTTAAKTTLTAATSKSRSSEATTAVSTRQS